MKTYKLLLLDLHNYIMKSRYYVFLPVRNSEKSIEKVMDSLVGQSCPPEKILAVNDGSTDGTNGVLQEFKRRHGDKIGVFQTKSTTRDYKRIPSLWNMCLQRRFDYHMIAAGDTIFEEKYAEKILKELEADPEIVVASGHYGKERVVFPHGAGRFVKQDYFFRFYDRYPEIVGYETETVYKAMVNGYKAQVLKNARFEHTDQLGHKHDFAEFGQSMRAMGFHPLYALGRTVLEVVKNDNIGRRGACNMFWKYITFRPESAGYYSFFPKEDREKIRNLQKKRMKEKLGRPFRR